MAVVEGATVRPLSRRYPPCVIGLVLSVVGLGFFCWLLFTLAVYALPFFAGLSAGLAAFHSGAGVIGALIVGVLAGGATLVIGQIAFATVRTPLIRALIGLLYAVPAGIAGYQASLGLAKIGVPVRSLARGFRYRQCCSRRRHRLCTHDSCLSRHRPGSALWKVRHRHRWRARPGTVELRIVLVRLSISAVRGRSHE